MKKNHLILLIIIWTSITIGSFIWNYSLVVSNNHKVVLNKSQAFFKQIVLARSWNSGHGGVYVPVSATTLPNPYLKDSLRDIVSMDGLQLTKLNPAYMSRQIAELSKEQSGLNFHITSLKPIRPENKADAWETKALKAFENGRLEILELIENNSGSQYRYMAPLMAEKSCLKCHSDQVSGVGDIRGGISVSSSSDLYEEAVNEQLLSFGIVHFLILIFGIIGLGGYYRMSKRYFLIIKNKNKELIKINASKDKFFSIIAHDLRGPLNIILGYINLLKTRYDDFDDVERKEFITDIDKSSKNTFELLESLLLWAKSQDDKIKLVKEDLNLKEVFNEIVSVYFPAVEKKKIKLDVGVSDELVIYADQFSMKTIISNLLNNAIKFTPEEGMIKIDAIQRDQFTEVSISDNGVGIPQEILPKLFLIEENVSTRGTDNEEGTGLGLLLCKEFVEKHNGEIKVNSELGKGTKITFTIPNKF